MPVVASRLTLVRSRPTTSVRGYRLSAVTASRFGVQLAKRVRIHKLADTLNQRHTKVSTARRNANG